MESQVCFRLSFPSRYWGEDDPHWPHVSAGSNEHDDHWMHDDLLQVRTCRSLISDYKIVTLIPTTTTTKNTLLLLMLVQLLPLLLI